ncbi:MAG TPA: protein kinase [Polyangiaceae bacterium]|nr:protein kinase [Polyangiaceae bacterium]
MSELLQPGQAFARRYRVQKFLAKGGFGAVYVAVQTETELRVALKVLWPHVLSSQDAVEKFKLEAKIAGRVNSEHIVKVFDAGFDEATDMPFLVMEYLEGLELQKVVDQGGPLPAERAILYLRQVASALDKAHGYVDPDGHPRPIVHRDLKPENLFLAHREDGDPLVKVLDFGIAKVLNDSTKVSQEVKGTPLYMAFEQACAGRITPQTDIWALGLIAFFCLTGHSYWKSANLPESSLTQLFGEILSLPIEPPSQRARDIDASVALPAAFDAWFLRCVNRDAEQRFASAGSCVAALAQAFGNPDTKRSPGAAPPDAFGATLPLVVGAASAPVSSNATPTKRAASAVPAQSVGKTSGALALAGTKPPEHSGRAAWPWLVAGAVLVGGAATGLVATRAGPAPDASASSREAASGVALEPSASGVPAAPNSAAPSSGPVIVGVAPSASAAVSAVNSSEPVSPKRRKKLDPWEQRQ